MKIVLTQDVDPSKGQVKGKDYDLPDSDAQLWIASGKAAAVAAPPAALPALPGNDGATMSGTVTEGIQTLIGRSFLAGVEAAEQKGGSGVRPEILQQLGQIGKHAEAKEDHSLNEWFQAVSYQTPKWAGRDEQIKAANILTKKYKTARREGEQFETDWGVTTKAGTTFDMETKASVQVENQGAVGGFTVPVEFYPQIIEIAYQESELFRRVDKYRMTGRDLLIPALDYSGGGSGASPYLAGMAAGWTAENVNLPQQNAKVRQIQLTANLLGGYTQASRQLLADNAVGFQNILARLMGQTIAFYVTYAIVQGTGASQPRGIINESAAISVTRTGDSSNGTMLADMATMKSKLLPGAEKRAMWMISPSTEAFLYQMTTGAGGLAYLPNFPGVAYGPASTTGNYQVLRIPIEINQYAAAHGSAADIILVDPFGYAWGERQDIEVAVSEHYAFVSNLLTWRFLFRGDGRSKLNTYLTLQNGDTVSPFVYRHA